MQKIILDTNILVSALISPNGIPSKIIDKLVIEGIVSICISNEIMQEYVSVINRNKFKKYRTFLTKAEILLGYIEEIAEKYFPRKTVDELKDKSDNKFLELALESKANFIVTGNINDFQTQEFGNTRILTPTEYWNKHKST